MVRGGSRGRKKPSLRTLSKELPTGEDYEKFIAELKGTSDRACALVATALLDNSLQGLILSHMRDDWDEIKGRVFEEITAPLGTLYSKAMTAYAFELIDRRLYNNIDRIRTIRNAFAHSAMPIDFKNDLIKKELDKLEIAGDLEIDALEERLIFTVCVVEIVMNITTAANRKLSMKYMIKAIREYEPSES